MKLELGKLLTVTLLLAATALAGTRAQQTERVGRLQGAAFSGRHKGVVGAAVVVRQQADSSSMFITSTDAGGQFRVEGLPDGEYRVSVKRHGFRPVIKEGISVRFPFRPVVEVTMEPAAGLAVTAASTDGTPSTQPISVAGHVVGRDGNPVGQTRLRFVHPSGRLDPRWVRTDAEGRFEISELPAGEWQLEARGVGFLPLRVQLELAQDTRFQFFLVRQPANYEPEPLELMPRERPIPPPE